VRLVADERKPRGAGLSRSSGFAACGGTHAAGRIQCISALLPAPLVEAVTAVRHASIALVKPPFVGMEFLSRRKVQAGPW